MNLADFFSAFLTRYVDRCKCCQLGSTIRNLSPVASTFVYNTFVVTQRFVVTQSVARFVYDGWELLMMLALIMKRTSSGLSHGLFCSLIPRILM